ncbi:uncharacterized protein LOC132722620 [Ruditapes philippinarum]|uniref:uncharacterized protein LOC132722620 n=1 Tax=Ruditapes philippinarum TaxID=129788 RepID=UPI00295B397D|nr:uncharacterized protein LOC132722620 [Ruditapes philippinarum]
MEEIKKTLSQYPSSFSVTETIATMSREEIKKKKHKLEIELESSEKEFSTDMEKLTVENFLSFLHFYLGDQVKAREFNDKVLDREPENMIALSNKAWFSLRDLKNIMQCKELCEHLKAIKRQNQLAFIIAKAEVAFTYSRLGIRNYKKASSEFENVLRDCEKIKELDNVSDSAANSTTVQVPTDYVCVWMYRKALCQRRQSNLNNNVELADIEEKKHYYSVTLDLYMNIIGLENCESDCIKRYKARSYVEMGFISYDVTRNRSVFPNGMEELIPTHSSFFMDTTDYFYKALEYYPDDVSVLEQSGKYFRYINEHKISIDLLTRAIQIKPTSFGYHHIALTFKRLLELNRGGLARQLLQRFMDCKDGIENFPQISTKPERCRNRGTNIAFDRSRLKSRSGIKCPKEPIIIDYNEHKLVVDKVIAYLDTSYEMSSNTNAIYDKALLYRQISQPETALTVLTDLLQNNDKFNTRIMLANIYEQSAFCISDMLLNSYDGKMNEKRDLEATRDFYLKSSIEISCALIDKIPSLENGWKSAATLGNLLNDKLETERTKDTLKELWYLYGKLNEHLDAVKILQELQTLANDTEEEREFIEGIVKHHFLMRNFEEAVIALCMSKQLKDGQPIIEKHLYIEVFIEAGLDAFRRQHYQKGNMRIKEAFRFVRESQQTHKNTEASDETNIDAEENESLDLFILSNLDDDENGRKLMMLLDNLGLKTTFNTDSPAITPGTPEVTGITDIMNKSNAFVVLKDFDTDNKKMQHIIDRMQSIVENRNTKTLILVVTLPESTEILPGSFYATHKTIAIDLKSVSEDSFFTVVPEGLKSLLMALASV